MNGRTSKYLLSLMFAEGDVAVSYPRAIIIKLLAVLLLVAANGFFVAAEFALVGVRRHASKPWLPPAVVRRSDCWDC